MSYLHLRTVILIVVIYICEVCKGSDMFGKYYEIKVDSSPTGQPFNALSNLSKFECATVCNKDPECTTFTRKEINHGFECEVFSCWEAMQTSPQNGVETFIKKGERLLPVKIL